MPNAVRRSGVSVWEPAPVTPRPELEPEHELDVGALDAAACELLVAAGRPEGWAIATEYEREAWRVAAERTIRAYMRAVKEPSIY